MPIEIADIRTWLTGTTAEASALVRIPEPDVYDAGPTVPVTASLFE